jgi:hypothetical protein
MAGTYDNILGRRFNRWTAVCLAGKTKSGQQLIRCRCDCGTVKDVYPRTLLVGESGSCGCLNRELTAARNFRHGAIASGVRPVEYSIWKKMRSRCGSQNSNDFHRYGARGITVCARWNNYANFVADMGSRPSAEYSLERKDNNAGYDPLNCIWATKKQQARNRRSNRMLTMNGQTQPVAAWAEEYGISAEMIYNRLDRGWPEDRAVLAPARQTRPRT